MKFGLSVLILFFLYTPIGFADDYPVYELRIKDHKFDKEVIKVKAGTKFRLIIYNDDNEFEEFESKRMMIEKFIQPKSKINLLMGPFKPNTYDFFADFHPSTGKGTLIAE